MESVFVNQGGDEIELRPLTARQYLSARLETERLSGEAENDEIARAVLLGAALLARGAYADGERLFSNVDEVLDTLTAQEIVETAAYIDITPETVETAVETAKKAVVHIDTLPETGKADGSVKSSVTPEDTEDAPSKSDTAEQSGAENKKDRQERQDQTRTRRRYVKWDGGGTYSTVSFSDSASAPSAAPARDDMRRVSDFFQRDSRRYDGAISNY